MTVQKNALRFVSFLLFTFLSGSVVAQYTVSTTDGLHKQANVPINNNCHGYLEYLPVGYTAPGASQKYPLMVYVNGNGSNGSGSASDLDHHWTGGGYPHEQQAPLGGGASTWQEYYTVNGQTFQFLIITPQFIQDLQAHIPTAPELNDVITYAIAHYRIDTSRIYLVGSSQGGGTVWDYAGYSSAYANRIAAIIPFAGVSYPVQEKANIMKQAKVKVWAFHNSRDNSVPSSFTTDYVKFYNNPPVPAVPAKQTLFDADGHQCWFLPLTRQYTEGGLNVYQWLLQYQSTPTTAFAGNDQEITLPANSVQLSGSGSAAGTTVSGYSWTKVSGPAGSTLTNANTATPTAGSLDFGTYIFRVTVTYANGTSATDDVAITVNPASQRIQAENFTSSSTPINTGIPGNDSLFITSTSDGTGANGIRVDGINYDNWMNYSITVPTAGTYRFRFRTGTGLGGTQFVVRNSSGTALDTVVVYALGYDSYMNSFADVPLAAGTQTIRIQSASTAFPQNNWFMNWFEVIDNPVAESTLPVNFVLFNARCVDDGVNLLWKTSGESNSKNFSIEKSSNGRDWSVLATLPAAGQSSTERSYTYRDNTGGNSFYRVVQSDFDGRKTNTSIIKSNCSTQQVFSVYPNPVDDKAILNITLEQKAKMNVSVIDSRGAVVRQQESILPEGASQMPVNMSGLAKGTYTLVAKWGSETRSVKLIKK